MLRNIGPEWVCTHCNRVWLVSVTEQCHVCGTRIGETRMVPDPNCNCEQCEYARNERRRIKGLPPIIKITSDTEEASVFRFGEFVNVSMGTVEYAFRIDAIEQMSAVHEKYTEIVYKGVAYQFPDSLLIDQILEEVAKWTTSSMSSTSAN